jgi:Rhodopirellula transposase DDE domain
MVTPAAKRETVAHVRSVFELSERRACRIIGCVRMTVQVCRTQTNRYEVGQTVLGCGSDDRIAMCHVKAVRHDVPLPSVHLPPGTSEGNKIEHRLFSFITQNGPHRDQSQNPLGACMLSRTSGLAKGAGWLSTPTELKLFFPCARALLLCSRPR